jgi:hypothetical protein
VILKARVVLKAETTSEFTFEGDLIVDDVKQAYEAGREFWTLALSVMNGMEDVTPPERP